MNHSRQLLNLSRAIHTQVVKNAAEAGPRTARLKELQKRLQIDDGTPVHLKAGIKDRVLYQFTALLTVIGLGMSADTLFRIVVGKKE